MARTVFVVTHTQALHHIEGRVGGWYDTGLTDKGRADAHRIASALRTACADQMVEITASDLLRASQTADTIGAALNRPVETTPALREISYGDAEGRPQSWLDARYSFAPADNRLDHNPGIAGAETRRQVAERVYPLMERIIARPCETQIIVTHGFTLTLVIAAWLKIPIESAGFLAFPAPSGSITELREEAPFFNRAIIRLADTSHLDR